MTTEAQVSALKADAKLAGAGVWKDLQETLLHYVDTDGQLVLPLHVYTSIRAAVDRQLAEAKARKHRAPAAS